MDIEIYLSNIDEKGVSIKNPVGYVKELARLKAEINAAWDQKENIEPCYTGMPKPGIIEILKLLPKINCRECNESTCIVFATKVAKGAKGSSDSPRWAISKEAN